MTKKKNHEALLQLQGVGKESAIYAQRFSDQEERMRESVWKLLCQSFFNKKFISANDVVVDLGAGDGLFSKYIKARKRIAIDISPHVLTLREQGVEVIQAPATQFAPLLSEKANVIFISNFFEHLPTKQLVLDVLDECKNALATNGKVIILQPNIRYVGVSYWDYIDHHIALTERSLVEALEVSGYRVDYIVPRFLPYTAKSLLGRLLGNPRLSFLMNYYLKMPFLWRFFGQQTLVVARNL